MNFRREELRTKAYAAVDAEHARLSAEIAAIAASHEAQLTQHTELQQFLSKSPADELLDFVRKDGVKKGSATLGARMDMFKAKFVEIKDALGTLWAEWDVTEREIEGVAAELREFVDDGGFEERAEEREREFLERVERLCTKAVRKMVESEKVSSLATVYLIMSKLSAT